MTGDRVTEINGAKVADALNTIIIDRDNLRRERDDIFTELKAITEERDKALDRLASRDAALARVEALHRRVPVFDTYVEDCGHDYELNGVEASDGDIYCITCVSAYTCSECAELNRDNPDGEIPEWPCPTIAALSGTNQEGKRDE